LTRAVFLDRDGVLNEAIVREGLPHPPSSVHELAVVTDAFSSLIRLRGIGFRLIVVTNQPDIARGKISRETVERINAYLLSNLPIDDVEVCPHDDADACDCRKPLAGMLLRAAQRHRLELGHSFMVGDRWRDIEAGRRAGCRTVLIDNGYREAIRSKPDAAVVSLTDAANYIIAMSKQQ
jgi:D-glycero-D-manno-heptose 1,7-bisphosphate phosphatase